ncbi:hypothetical protein KPH14_002687 [Odynerus spinipes]|uniref:Uncharacterized protein n=1 Tax=Odynerus spinipes TaxID=1348599 RepID=A0AAD9VIS6_9HYME|nr:hypothetical protein KPH14_002687 [Odynerus spinipes]
MRDCFTREINRQKTLKSGFGGGSRKNEYLVFQQLQFLKNVVAIREPDSVTVTAGPADDLHRDRNVVKGPKRIKTKESTVSEDDKFVEAVNKSIESRDQPFSLQASKS